MSYLVSASFIAILLAAPSAQRAKLVLVPTKTQEGKILSQTVPKIKRAYVYSESNDNEQFSVAIVIEPSESWGGYVNPKFYADGRETSGSWGIVANDGKISSVYCRVARTDAEAIANALGVVCAKRKKPDFKAKVKFEPEKKVFRLREQKKKKNTIESLLENKIGMSLTVTNIGTDPFNVTLWTPRGEPYDFTLTVHQSGKELKYTGTPFSFGAFGATRTLARGESESKNYDLADWYSFDKPGRYTVHVKYRTTLSPPRNQQASWPENCQWAHQAWEYEFEDSFTIDVVE